MRLCDVVCLRVCVWVEVSKWVKERERHRECWRTHKNVGRRREEVRRAESTQLNSSSGGVVSDISLEINFGLEVGLYLTWSLQNVKEVFKFLFLLAPTKQQKRIFILRPNNVERLSPLPCYTKMRLIYDSDNCELVWSQLYCYVFPLPTSACT